MPQSLDEQFVQALIAHQDQLYAYILSLVGVEDSAEEVLQETNLAISRRADEFTDVQNFAAWACRAAYFQVLAFRKRRHRDRLQFDDELITKLADKGVDHTAQNDARRAALRHCLSTLSANHAELVLRRYAEDGSVERLAKELGRSVGSISQTLYRIRGQLLDCIRRTLAREEVR